MNRSNPSIAGIAEISLRVHDLVRMRRFYEDVLGLELLREYQDAETAGKAIFYAVGPGDENLALFEEALTGWFTRGKSPQVDPAGTTLSHLAFRVALADLEPEKQRLEQMGIEIVESGSSSWMHSRMFYFFDPEGNLIEFKSRDESVG